MLELADRAGVDVGEVYRVDASRQTTGINAYVDGIGSTKRVVLYDNLLKNLDRGERRSVVAHELVPRREQRHPRGLLLAGARGAARAAARSRAGRAVARRREAELGPLGVAGASLALAATSFGLGVVGNSSPGGSRRARTPAALELTDDPEGLIRVQRARRHQRRRPLPPGFTPLFGTHPTAMERIGGRLAGSGASGP